LGNGWLRSGGRRAKTHQKTRHNQWDRVHRQQIPTFDRKALKQRVDRLLKEHRLQRNQQLDAAIGVQNG
jgi:hypothetical protein